MRVPPHFVGLVGEQSERPDERLRHPRERGVENVHDVIALEPDDLPVEPVEEDRVPRLVLYLCRNMELFLFAGADHEHRQLDLDLPFAMVESRSDGHERLPLGFGHLLLPVDFVLAEVELIDIPPLLQVLAVQGEEVRQRLQVLVDVLDDVVDVYAEDGLEVGLLDLADLLIGQSARAFMEHSRRALAFRHSEEPPCLFASAMATPCISSARYRASATRLPSYPCSAKTSQPHLAASRESSQRCLRCGPQPN